MKNVIITISRQYGSGGRQIAQLLSKELNIPYYDNELISMAAEKSGIKDEIFKDAELQAGNNFLYLLQDWVLKHRFTVCRLTKKYLISSHRLFVI